MDSWQTCNFQNFVCTINIKDYLRFRPNPDLKFIDHIVGNMPNNEMEAAVQWYF
jgi:4-hydroxyphenylpyruvate dioxygenase-like putative hemolysin